MKRRLLYIPMLLIVVLLVLSVSGCSLFSKTKAVTPTAAPAPAEQPTLPPLPPAAQPTLPPLPPVDQPTLPPIPTQAPAKPVPVDTAQPQAAAPTQAPLAPAAAPPGSQFFKETFGNELQNWTHKWVTGNSQDRAVIQSGNGSFSVTIPPKEESAIKFYKEGVSYDDVVVVGDYQNLGDSNNGFALLCRKNDKGFYEFRVSSSGLYSIYRYEYALVDQNINPYVFIAEGGTNLIHAGVDKQNIIEMDCVGKEFSFYINGKLLKTIIPSALRAQYLKYPSGGVGFGVMSYNNTFGQVQIQVNSITTMASHQP